MDEERRIFVDGSIAIDDGKIEAIGTDREIEAEFSSLNVRDLNGAVVHPGLVAAHVHTGMDLIRGLVPESSANWTNVETPFLRSRTSEDDYLSTLICCMEMVSNGSTIYSDTGSSYDLDATARATELVGLRGMPGEFVSSFLRSGELGELLENWFGHGVGPAFVGLGRTGGGASCGDGFGEVAGQFLHFFGILGV